MYNPAAQIKAAWAGTHSAFGKVAVALLYLFIWMQLLWTIAILANPRAGFECAYQDAPDATAYYMDSLMVGLNVISCGYFLSAHYYGIRPWNVLIFALLGGATLANNYRAASGLLALDGDGCAGAFGGGLVTQNAVFSAIVGATVLCSLADWARGRDAAPTGEACTLNPISQVRAAWDGTASAFGKLSAVLLYAFVWMEVVGNVAMSVYPSDGKDFAYDGAPDAAVIFMDCLTVGTALFTISYVAYVHYHGVRLWNVLSLAAVTAAVVANDAVLVDRLGGEAPAFAADKGDERVFLTALVGLMVVPR